MVINIVKYIQGGINSALNFWRNIMLKLIKNICDVKKTWNVDVRGVQLIPEEVSQSSVVVTYHGENDVDFSIHTTLEAGGVPTEFDIDTEGVQLLNMINAVDDSDWLPGLIINDRILIANFALTSSGQLFLQDDMMNSALMNGAVMNFLSVRCYRDTISDPWRIDDGQFTITSDETSIIDQRIFFAYDTVDTSTWKLVYDMPEGVITLNKVADGYVLTSMTAGKYKNYKGEDIYILSDGNEVTYGDMTGTATYAPEAYPDSIYTNYVAVCITGNISTGYGVILELFHKNQPSSINSHLIRPVVFSVTGTLDSTAENVVFDFATITPVPMSYVTINDTTQG